MSLEASTRTVSITVLSSKLSSSSPSLPTDATRPPPFTTTLSPQAEPFTMPSVLSSLPITDGQVSSPFLSSSPNPAEADSKIEDQMEADPSIVEALKSKERLFVLRVGEDMERIINERKGRVEITTATSYQRLLVHRCSAYYKVIPESDSGSKSIWVAYSLESRIPPKRISELVPLEQTKQPAIKIMSRSVQDRIRAQSQSRTSSVNGEDAESSDVEPSEAGSLGGRSAAVRSKKALTLEERSAAYNEARSRIFLDFEKKTKEKDNDMSASSSTFSLVSGSASTSGGGSSSAGDMDDSISTAPTESEFSGPVARDNKNERRNGSGANSAGSSRATMLPPKHPSSSRGSRASSPSLTYASIYDPGSNPVPYDAGQAVPMQRPYPQHLVYHYPPPSQEQGPGQGFVQPQPIPYYSYGYPQPPPLPPLLPPHHASTSEPPGPTADPQASGIFLPPAHHPQQMMYMAPQYSWAPNSPPVPSSGGLSGTHSLPHPHPSQYSFAPPSTPQYGGYNIPPFYPPMGPMHTPAQGQQPLPQPTHPVGMSPMLQGNDLGIRVMPPITMNNDHVDPRGRKRGNSRNGSGSFSHGPMFGCSFGVSGMTGGSSPIENNTNIVGPRLNNSMRRTSGTSNGSRTPGDEASSVASSTSSSSRTTSSQHPLPARPDWAVGLKPNPTLHPTRPSGRNGGSRNHSANAPAVLLQSADFPPLGGVRTVPVPTGVWTSGAGKAREPGGGIHRDGDGSGGGNSGLVSASGVEGMERMPSKGQAQAHGLRVPRVVSAPPSATAPVPSEDTCIPDLTDGVNALVLDKAQS